MIWVVEDSLIRIGQIITEIMLINGWIGYELIITLPFTTASDSADVAYMPGYENIT